MAATLPVVLEDMASVAAGTEELAPAMEATDSEAVALAGGVELATGDTGLEGVAMEATDLDGAAVVDMVAAAMAVVVAMVAMAAATVDAVMAVAAATTTAHTKETHATTATATLASAPTSNKASAKTFVPKTRTTADA